MTGAATSTTASATTAVTIDSDPIYSDPIFSGGNELLLLKGGDTLFPAMAGAMGAATDEVWLATYIFHHDAAGAAMVAALRAAAGRGVRVRVVVDGFGSKASLGWLKQGLEGSGVALAVFRPIDRWYRWLQPGQLRRLHQKLCIVDDQHAFVGGINIIEDRVDLNQGQTDLPRLDFAVHLRGPIVRDVTQAARAIWTRAWLGRDYGEELRALVRSREPLARLRGLLRRVRLPRTTQAMRQQASAAPPTSRQDLAPVCAAFVLRDNLRRRRTIERAYITAIRAANSRVDLITPYFYPGHAFRRELVDAAKRGVRVRLLLQGKVDYRIAGMAAEALYAELLGHGVQVFEYMPAYLHAKVGVVDDAWATVGSSNIDPLSLLLNLEANVVVRDRDFAAAMVAQFDQALGEARQVDLKQRGGSGLRGAARRALVAWVAYVYLRVAGATGKY